MNFLILSVKKSMEMVRALVLINRILMNRIPIRVEEVAPVIHVIAVIRATAATRAIQAIRAIRVRVAAAAAAALRLHLSRHQIPNIENFSNGY